MPKEKSKLEKLMKIMQAADEEMFETLGVPQKQRTPRFAQILREAVHEPPGRAGPRGDRAQISTSPGPRYRAPVSPERVGPPAPYEYIGGRLEQEMPRTRDLPRYWHGEGPVAHDLQGHPLDERGELLAKQRELQLRAYGHTPQEYYKERFQYHDKEPFAVRHRSQRGTQLGRMKRPTDTMIANPRYQREADLALEILREKK